MSLKQRHAVAVTRFNERLAEFHPDVVAKIEDLFVEYEEEYHNDNDRVHYIMDELEAFIG